MLLKTLMLLRKPSIFFKSFTTQTPASLKWRKQIDQTHIISQVSNVLLQRQNWVPLLQKLNLAHKLTPSLFIRVLDRTENNPQVSLDFFEWAKTNSGFEPDLRCQYKIIQILANSGLQQKARSHLDSVAQLQPSSVVFSSLIEACKGSDSQSVISSFVLECYSDNGLITDGIEIYRRIRVCNYLPSTHSCNKLLDGLQKKGEIKLGWVFLGSIIRYGVSMDSSTWLMGVRLFCKEKKMENAVKVLNSGVNSVVVYDLVIEGYCKMGNFPAAMDLLNDMCVENLNPGLSVYSSVLDGACRFGDFGLVEKITEEIRRKELFSGISLLDYNRIIQKLCELGRSYAAEMFFERARREKIELLDCSYRYLLSVLCKEERVKEAMETFRIIVQKEITLDHDCYRDLANSICKEEPSEEVENLLHNVINMGVVPSSSILPNFIAFQCRQGRWKEAEGLLNLMLEKGVLANSFCCCSLIEHYCGTKQIHLAVELHDKIEKLGGSLDSSTYTVLLSGLFKVRKSVEAIQIFDYMRRQDVVTSSSFSIMIAGLCHEKKMRKAMRIHDEMLKMGMKPCQSTYRRLIAKFS